MEGGEDLAGDDALRCSVVEVFNALQVRCDPAPRVRQKLLGALDPLPP
jgi:hypothetical protein